MRVRVHGVRILDFVSDGGKIQGTQIFISYPKEDVTGEITDKVFVRQGFPLPPELAPGKIIDIFCDTKGRVEAIQIVSAVTK